MRFSRVGISTTVAVLCHVGDACPGMRVVVCDHGSSTVSATSSVTVSAAAAMDATATAACRQEQRVFGIQAAFSKLVHDVKGSRTGLFLRAPLVLLAMRSALDSLFRAVYPLWCHTVEAFDALQAMDEVRTVAGATSLRRLRPCRPWMRCASMYRVHCCAHAGRGVPCQACTAAEAHHACTAARDEAQAPPEQRPMHTACAVVACGALHCKSQCPNISGATVPRRTSAE